MQTPMFNRFSTVLALLVVSAGLFPRAAGAEITLTKTDTWEVYTDGRVGGFLSYWRGNGLPPSPVNRPNAGGVDNPTIRDVPETQQGTITGMRVRSGFVGTVFGLGIRRAVTPSTMATAYIQTWSYVESQNRLKYQPNPTDVRQAYLQLEGFWGKLTIGRQRALYSRGATDINYRYQHAYALGFPGAIEPNGPTNGHIGFGVLANGFAAGIVYATPVLAGLQLTVGVFDPSRLEGMSFDRAKYGRLEGELTFERAFLPWLKVFIFSNGAYQRMYRSGESTNADAYGVGAGEAVEIGPVRMGFAWHRGKVVGLNYAFEWNQVGTGITNSEDGSKPYLRTLDGYYYVLQYVVSSRLDLSLGWGVTRIYRDRYDVIYGPVAPDPEKPEETVDRYINKISLLKQQMGYSTGAVFHAADFLHFSLDYFLADFQWYGGGPNLAGERQKVHFVNLGGTMTW